MAKWTSGQKKKGYLRLARQRQPSSSHAKGKVSNSYRLMGFDAGNASAAILMTVGIDEQADVEVRIRTSHLDDGIVGYVRYARDEGFQFWMVNAVVLIHLAESTEVHLADIISAPFYGHTALNKMAKQPLSSGL